MREPAAERLANLARIDPRRLGQGQGLGDGPDVEPDNDLIGRLGDLPGSRRADMGDLAAQHLKHRQGPVEGRVEHLA